MMKVVPGIKQAQLLIRNTLRKKCKHNSSTIQNITNTMPLPKGPKLELIEATEVGESVPVLYCVALWF